MKVQYCPDCGTEILKGNAFCGECGTKIIQEEALVKIAINHCTSCDYSTIEDDIFCPECGARMSQKVDAVSISDDVPFQTKDIQQGEHSHQSNKEPLKSKTESIRKPKRQKQSKKPITIAKQLKAKKKGGFLRLAGKLVLGFILFMIVGSVVLYNLDDSEWEDSQWDDDYSEVPSSYGNEKTDGTPAQKTRTRPKTAETKSKSNERKPKPNERKSIKQVASQVEQIFENADTTALKQILTKTSLSTYDGVFTSIAPYMNDYASAFKNRKLEVNTTMYSLYSFKDKNGKKFTVEFAQVDDGVWKLVRF
jgi:hypothetical protein